jgi:hypothetical protein
VSYLEAYTKYIDNYGYASFQDGKSLENVGLLKQNFWRASVIPDIEYVEGSNGTDRALSFLDFT